MGKAGAKAKRTAEPPRPASETKATASIWPVVAVILLVAAALRVAGLRWGLPNQAHNFSYHPDEIFLLLPSVGPFAHGDWNPHFFNYGTLYIYLVGLPATLLGTAPARFPQGLAPLYLLARGITALLGTASVGLLYLAVRREGRGLALLGAALLAVLPLHSIDSHYATVDVPATFFLVLAFLLALRGAASPSLKRALPAGLAVGLAAATKYNVGLFLISVLAAPLLPPRRKLPRRWSAGVVLAALAGFCIGCPFVGDPGFLQGLLFELNHARVGGTFAFVGAGSGWGYHLLHGLPIALGFPLLLALLLGVVAAVRLSGRAARVSLLWCLLYFAMIGFSKERFIRYLVPMTPFLAVIAASGLLWLWRAPRTHLGRALAAAVGLAVVLFTGLYSWGQVRPFTRMDPRDRACGGTPLKMVLEARGLRSPRVGLVQRPWYFSPPVSPYNAGPFFGGWFDAWNRQTSNRIAITGWEAAKLHSLHPTAFVLSDLETADLLRLKDPKATAFVAALGRTYMHRVRFARASAPFAWLAPGRAWGPPDWLYASPQIDVYSDMYGGA